MRKHTTLDLDQVLVQEAAVVLGTIRVTETVHAALAEVVARRRRAMLARLDLPDLTPDSLAAMRSPRQPFESAKEPVRADERATHPGQGS